MNNRCKFGIRSLIGSISIIFGSAVLAQPQDEPDGYTGATDAEAPPVSDMFDTDYESRLLSNTRQLVVEGSRSGEGYFSADGTELIYQAEMPGNPFYQIYLMDLETEEFHMVSTGIGLTTCAWIHPTQDRVLFSSTHEDPQAMLKQQEEMAFRARGEDRPYSWDYDPYYDIFVTDKDGGNMIKVTDTFGYDAEGSFSPDGSKILFASNREAYTRQLSMAELALLEDDSSYFMDLYIMDADGSNVKQLTFSPGYDGGPFFNAEGDKIVWRRFNPDGNSAEVWTMNVDGTESRQITANAMVNWGPYFHPSDEYIIYSTNILGHANFELFMVDLKGMRPPIRVTNTAGTDILPVFSPDGNTLIWSTTRTPGSISQIHTADWDHELAMALLGR